MPQGQGQPMPPLQHMHHQQFYPSPYAHIKPQQSQAQAQVQIQAQAQAHPHPQIQAHSHQYGGGGGSMAPPPNMAAMSAGMMPAAMSHQQMHMRNTSSERLSPLSAFCDDSTCTDSCLPSLQTSKHLLVLSQPPSPPLPLLLGNFRNHQPRHRPSRNRSTLLLRRPRLCNHQCRCPHLRRKISPPHRHPPS